MRVMVVPVACYSYFSQGCHPVKMIACLAVMAMSVPAPGLSQTAAALHDGDWTGGYVGLSVGQGDLSAQFFGRDIELGDIDLMGVHGGYRRDLGRAVIGGDLGIDRVRIDDLDASGALIRGQIRLGADLGLVQPYLSAGVARLSADPFSETVRTLGGGVVLTVTDRFEVGLDYTRIKIDEAMSDRLGGRGVPVDSSLAQMRASLRF